jgi:hypothetical protein
VAGEPEEGTRKNNKGIVLVMPYQRMKGQRSLFGMLPTPWPLFLGMLIVSSYQMTIGIITMLLFPSGKELFLWACPPPVKTGTD